MSEVMQAIKRAGYRLSWCGYCDNLCLAGKRSACCGDAVYDNDERIAQAVGAGS